ncbi:AsmA family protein [uncultured Oxalicibacterium sp.]|uniref:AsmA family protein n=1 Tax=uncultured Oxalicibacterium sp. TaxID=1168540 RepID=UPI0025FEE726|nr:AsmA family protein [uncultured Oxalicibacterium sp.]
MREWRKWAWAGAAAGTLLLILAAVFLYRLADGEQLKQFAQDKVRQAWGRELGVGDLSVSLLPYPHLEARDVSVSNPEWAHDPHLLVSSRIEARFALLPLIGGKFVLESLRFDGLQTNFEIGKDGQRNWDMPGERHLQASDIELTDLRIRNSTVTWRQAEAEPYSLHITHLEAEGSAHLRNVALDAVLRRNDQDLTLKAEFNDLAALGKPGASTGGMLFAKSDQSTLLIKGTLPISLEPQSYAFSAAMNAPSLASAYRFFALDQRSPVPLKLDLQAQGAGRKLYISDLKLEMGKLQLLGALQIDRSTSRQTYAVDLHANLIDMRQTLLDAGRPAGPEKPSNELFRDKPLPWPLLSALQGMDGRIDARIDLLRLRNGIEVKDARAQARTRDDTMDVAAFSGTLLDGGVQGDATFVARSRAVRLNMELDKTLLSQWFKQTGKKLRVDQGRMRVDMRVETHGESMKELAANITGPLNINIGQARIDSAQAGQAEYWLNGLFSAKDAKRVDMACFSAKLPFKDGVAKGSGIVGARSDASQLLTSGTVDMRKQTLDLRGKVRARSGISLGISTFANEVKITGRIAKPEMGLDESGAVGALARIGAAIVTSGVSIVVTSIWDGANPESDPCQVVFSRK